MKKFSSLSDLQELAVQKPATPPAHHHDGKGKTVRVSLDTRGRKGKTVTLVTGLQHNPATMEEIAKILKQYCGAGGTVKEGIIEIQGNQKERVIGKMKELNYAVKIV